MQLPTLSDIRQAAELLTPYAHKTPVLSSSAINQILGMELFFKCENFQKVGAFKFRGGCNTVFSLSAEEAKNGVATHSSGNHAQAVALAANMRGVPAHIVMPENAPTIKKKAVAGYGARIISCEATLAAREATLAAVVEETGAAFVHPYNDPRVICGQGTAALELLEEKTDLDMVMTPIGGGGLMSGTAIVAKSLFPSMKVVGAEPKGADDAYRSFKANRHILCENPQTIADGLRTSLGTLTFEIITNYVDNILTVSEEAIIKAMRLIWERMKIIIEPSCAVPLAALMEHGESYRGKKIGIILTGGNVDLENLPWMN